MEIEMAAARLPIAAWPCREGGPVEGLPPKSAYPASPHFTYYATAVAGHEASWLQFR
jgi:hypothetical protein